MAIEDAYGNPKVSTSNDVAFEKGERHGAKHGAGETQKEVGGQSYPGRPLPKAEAVTDAKEDKGAYDRCVRKQLGENLKPMNPHVKEKDEYGPNN